VFDTLGRVLPHRSFSGENPSLQLIGGNEMKQKREASITYKVKSSCGAEGEKKSEITAGA
jgi:hypothetical protein